VPSDSIEPGVYFSTHLTWIRLASACALINRGLSLRHRLFVQMFLGILQVNLEVRSLVATEVRESCAGLKTRRAPRFLQWYPSASKLGSFIRQGVKVGWRSLLARSPSAGCPASERLDSSCTTGGAWARRTTLPKILFRLRCQASKLGRRTSNSAGVDFDPVLRFPIGICVAQRLVFSLRLWGSYRRCSSSPLAQHFVRSLCVLI
jgi:hypothetical protein